MGLVVAGGLAAALSTAAGLLLVISTSISHDLLKNYLRPDISEKNELYAARVAIAVAVVAAGLAGLNPPGFVAQVVALAFGLAASSFFPAIILGIFDQRMNTEGAITGMIVGIVFTASYILYFKPQLGGPGLPEKAKAHLFKPFQGTATGGGSGLGLAIVQELMRGHGGSAEYLEANGAGACFRLTLPKLTLDNAE